VTVLVPVSFAAVRAGPGVERGSDARRSSLWCISPSPQLPPAKAVKERDQILTYSWDVPILRDLHRGAVRVALQRAVGLHVLPQPESAPVLLPERPPRRSSPGPSHTHVLIAGCIGLITTMDAMADRSPIIRIRRFVSG